MKANLSLSVQSTAVVSQSPGPALRRENRLRHEFLAPVQWHEGRRVAGLYAGLGPRPLLTLCRTSSLLGALVAPVHRQTFLAQRVQIAPDAALVPTTLVTMCAEDLSEGKNRRRVKFWRC